MTPGNRLLDQTKQEEIKMRTKAMTVWLERRLRQATYQRCHLTNWSFTAAGGEERMHNRWLWGSKSEREEKDSESLKGQEKGQTCWWEEFDGEHIPRTPFCQAPAWMLTNPKLSLSGEEKPLFYNSTDGRSFSKYVPLKISSKSLVLWNTTEFLSFYSFSTLILSINNFESQHVF